MSVPVCLAAAVACQPEGPRVVVMVRLAIGGYHLGRRIRRASRFLSQCPPNSGFSLRRRRLRIRVLESGGSGGRCSDGGAGGGRGGCPPPIVVGELLLVRALKKYSVGFAFLLPI